MSMSYYQEITSSGVPSTIVVVITSSDTVYTRKTTIYSTGSATSSKDAVLPLTTVFTPPSDCFTLYTDPYTFSTSTEATYYYDGDEESTSYRTHYYTTGETGQHKSCWPSGFDSVKYYSPGLCPLSWSAVSNSSNVVNSFTETHAVCCPSNLKAENDNNGVYCASPTFDYVTNDDNVVAHSTGLGQVAPVKIAWQSNDFPAPVSNSNNDTNGLGTGAKAGIGVGVSLGVICAVAIALGYFFLRRKRNNTLLKDSDMAMELPNDRPIKELPNDRPLNELPTATYFTQELAVGNSDPVPLKNSPVELDSNPLRS